MNLKVLFFMTCLWCSLVGVMRESMAQGKNMDLNVVADGLLPVYKSNDKIYVLIAEGLLDRDFMITAQIDKGRGMYGEALASKGVFSLRAGEDGDLNVYGVAVTEQMTGKGWMSGEHPELGGLKIPQKTWKAGRRMDGGYLLEITDWLKESGEWYSFDKSLWISDFDAPAITGVTAGVDGVCFRVRHCVNISTKQGVVEMAAENGKAYVDVSVALKLLPQDCGKCIIMFPDSPFKVQKAVDYGISPFGCAECSRGVHWNISKETPLKICVDVDMPEEYRKALQGAITKVSKEAGIVGSIVMESKNQPLDAMDQCGVVFAGDGKEVEVEYLEHPGTGVLLFGRLSVGEKNMAAKILRWQLKNMVQGDDGRWNIRSKEYAYEKCLEEDMMKGLLMLLGIDEAKLEEAIRRGDVWNSMRFVYAGDWTCAEKKSDGSADGNLWGQFMQMRHNRRELLEQLDLKTVLSYYRQCLALGEGDYVSVFKRGDWRNGDVKRLLEFMNEDASGYYATEYIRKNMFGRDARETSGSLERVWCEFFNLDRWLEWARRQDCDEILGVLERELKAWRGDGKRRKSLNTAEMMVRSAFSRALSKQLKSCRETINYGSGVAENRVLSCWESLEL